MAAQASCRHHSRKFMQHAKRRHPVTTGAILLGWCCTYALCIGASSVFTVWLHLPSRGLLDVAREKGSRRNAVAMRAAGTVDTATSSGLYKALTKIRIRLAPEVSAPTLAESASQALKNGEIVSTIEAGEVFEVSEEKTVTGQTYLKLATQDGWVFRRGVAGEWKDKDIIALVPEKEALNEQAKTLVSRAGRQLLPQGYDKVIGLGLGALFIYSVVVNIYIINS
mmetsp:Transcript_28507/g.55814  ORF Transcript_28507/g.55814 Transcript_28507/m.55814 type:complete len:224 (-) Transcript_28507:96-767(-)